MALRCALLSFVACSACLPTPAPGGDAGTPLGGACSPSRRGQVPALRRVHSAPVRPSASYWAEALDADGDGDLDLYASTGSDGLQLFLNDGQKLAQTMIPNRETGALVPREWSYSHDGYLGSWPLFHDFQKDGRPDLYVAHDRSTNSADGPVVQVYLAEDAGPSGEYIALSSSAVPGATYGSYALADFDGDDTVDLFELGRHEGDEDFMVVHKRRTLPDGGAGYVEFWRQPQAGQRGEGFIVDLDGDGDRDLLFADKPGGSIQFVVFVNDGQGRFQAAAESSDYSTPDPETVRVGDFNGDRRADVMFQLSGRPPYQVVVGLNTDGEHFTFTRYSGAMTLVADVDGDCSLDLIGNDHLWGAPNVRLNDGAGNFDQAVSLDIGSRSFAAGAGDWSGDGCADFMVTPSGATQWDVMKSER